MLNYVKAVSVGGLRLLLLVMKNNRIKVLIFSIATAVIALIAMQYYWVHSSTVLRKDDFSRNAIEAIKSVSIYLERYEAASFLEAKEQERYLFIDEDAKEKINIGATDTSFDYMLVERLEQKGNEVNVTVEERKEGISTQDFSGTHKRNLPKFGIENQDDWRFGGTNPYKGISLNKELESRIEHNNAFLGEIAKSLKRINFTDKLEDRIDSLFLDSLLHLALYERGILTNFEFGVFDHLGKFRFGSKEKPSEKLIQSPYKTRLFRNDLLGKPGYLKIFFPKEKGFVLKSTMFMLITSLLVVIAIIYIFYWTVKAIIIQKMNSEIKNDFINNMTHELKTPISTISLAVEVLNDPVMASNKDLLGRYLKMINEENKRLGMLVEEVLQSAVLDRDAFKLKLEPVNIAQLLTEVVSKMDIKIQERKGKVSLDIDPTGNYDFMGDRVHLTNVMYNLMDNAIKYSADEPLLKIELLNVVNQIAIKVSDNGIGIAKEHVEKVFDKLYRVPTGNLHDVKGFGLGLNYVKTIVTRHQGSVDVSSVLGKGTTFMVYFPLAKINDTQIEK